MFDSISSQYHLEYIKVTDLHKNKTRQKQIFLGRQQCLYPPNVLKFYTKEGTISYEHLREPDLSTWGPSGSIQVWAVGVGH